MDIRVVRYSVRLDTAAIQGRASLKTWAEVLGMVPVDPKSKQPPGWVTWDLVYQELATVLIGSGHYKAYSQTALSDHRNLMEFARTLDISVDDEPKDKPTLKVVTPTIPAPTKTSNKAKA